MPELLRTAEFWVGKILAILFALIVVEKKGYLKKFLRKYPFPWAYCYPK